MRHLFHVGLKRVKYTFFIGFVFKLLFKFFNLFVFVVDIDRLLKIKKVTLVLSNTGLVAFYTFGGLGRLLAHFGFVGAITHMIWVIFLGVGILECVFFVNRVVFLPWISELHVDVYFVISQSCLSQFALVHDVALTWLQEILLLLHHHRFFELVEF